MAVVSPKSVESDAESENGDEASRNAELPAFRDYQKALASLAAGAGISPEELDSRLRARAARPRNPECLTLDEIEFYVTRRGLSEKRRQHAKSCAECAAVLSDLHPDAAETERFQHDRRALASSGAARVPRRRARAHQPAPPSHTPDLPSVVK